MSLLRATFNLLAIAKPSANAQTRHIKRWIAPTLRELRIRTKKLGPQPPEPRSNFIEWNLRAELFAFGKRLQEDFQMPLLQTAFTQRSYVIQEQKRQRDLGVEESDLPMTDNEKLAERGAYLAREYVEAYLQYSLPLVPAEGRQAFAEYLLGAQTLSKIGFHLGMKDLIFSAEYPPTEQAFAQTLLAVIGALAESSGVERSFAFVRDFICTQLNQCDLLQLWKIEDPMELLQSVCKERKISEPEPRLIGDCGKNTVLAAYHVGVYVDKQMIGQGFGEDLPTAINTASLDALQTFFGMRDNMRPFNFQLEVQPKNLELTQN